MDELTKVRLNTIQYNICPHIYKEINGIKTTIKIWRDDMQSMLRTWDARMQEIRGIVREKPALFEKPAQISKIVFPKYVSVGKRGC